MSYIHHLALVSNGGMPECSASIDRVMDADYGLNSLLYSETMELNFTAYRNIGVNISGTPLLGEYKYSCNYADDSGDNELFFKRSFAYFNPSDFVFMILGDRDHSALKNASSEGKVEIIRRLYAERGIGGSK